MDGDAVKAVPFVVGVDFHDDGTYGVRFRVAPGGPYPGAAEPAGEMGGYWESAAACTAADWPDLTADQLGASIEALWAGQAATYAPPAPVNTWFDGQIFAGSRYLTSAAGGFGDVAGHDVTESDAAGAVTVGTTVAEVLDPNHLLLSQPATAEDSALAFSLTPP